MRRTPISQGYAAEPGGRTRPEARLLVVDDEPNIVELLAASLRFAGFDVATATNGPDALAAARSVRPDLVVLDVMMPGLDGFDVLRRLRDDGTRTPVLFLTARDATEDKVAPDARRRRLRHQAVQPGRADRPHPGSAAPRRELRHAHPAGLRRHRAGRRQPRGAQGRETGGAVADRVQAAELLPAQPEPGVEQGADPRPRVELRLRRRGEHRRVLRSYLRRKVDTTEPRLIATVRGVGYVLRRRQE